MNADALAAQAEPAVDEPDEPDEDGATGSGLDERILHVGRGHPADDSRAAAGPQSQAAGAGSPELQLPVVVAHDVENADVVMTIKTDYRQKTPTLRGEERALPSSSRATRCSRSRRPDVDLRARGGSRGGAPRAEDAIDLVLSRSAVELSPPNAFIRRLQHQMAERANVVSRHEAASRTVGCGCIPILRVWR